MTPSKTSLFALASAGAVICSTQAIAQTAEPATERAVGLSEIVVTAERREQRLQDVPITISAADEAVIKAQAIRDSMDIARVAPGVIINKSIGAATPFVRGVGIISSGFANELPVAVYLDEFYLATPAAGVFSLNNIQRVEVLKGPQGTLFGRNAQGGVIHVITKAPSQEQHLDANVGYGNYNTFSGDLYATGAVTENLALSLAASGSHQGDGWGTNVFTGSDIFKTEGYSLQGRALWTPSDRTRVDLIALFDSRMTDVGIQYGIVPGSVGVDGTTFIDDFDVANRQDRKAKANQSLLGIKFSHDLGFARLVSLTGRSDIHSKFSFNQSGLPGQPIAGRTANETELDGKAYAFTQEIQLLSPSDSSVSWILGGFYLDSRDELDQIVHGTCVGLVCAGPVPVLIQGRQDTRSYAAFGQATFEVLPRTRMTLGLRYTEDEKSTEESRALPAPGFANSPTAIPAIQLARPGLPYPGNPNGIEPNKTWSKLTWRASVDHKLTEDIMIFASANRGYKAGTYNITGFTNPPANPEVLDAYEVGFKSTLLDRRLRFNAAAYYYDYQNIQVRSSAPPAPPGQVLLSNAARSTIKGLDIEVVAAPTAELTLNAAVTFLDAKYDSFPGGSCIFPATRTATVLGGNATVICEQGGYRMIRSPKVSGNIGVTYRRDTSFGEILANLTDVYTGSYVFDASGRLKQPATHLVSGSLTWTSADGKYEAQLWGKNLLDEFHYQVAFEAGNDIYSPAEPRTFGVRLGVHY